MADNTEELPERNTIVVEDATMRAGFVMLPYLILESRVLSHGAKIAYGLLLKYAWQDGSCYPGQERMAADLDVARNSVGRYIGELVDAGVIVVKRRGQGKTNLYILPRLTSAADAPKIVHQETPKIARLDAPRIVRNVDPLTRRAITSPPLPPVNGGRRLTRQEKKALAESPDKYFDPNAKYPMCRQCGALKTLCECAATP